jgi:hypothetical protein
MIAPCGIDCGPCPIRRAANDPGFRARFTEEARGSWAPDATEDWWKCQGCGGDDSLCWGSDCGIRHCCLGERELQDCSWCADFPCRLIEEFDADEHEHHSDAVDSLRRMRASRD